MPEVYRHLQKVLPVVVQRDHRDINLQKKLKQTALFGANKYNKVINLHALIPYPRDTRIP